MEEAIAKQGDCLLRYHFPMRRLLAIALLAALPAAAQIHGVPPSVTSITPGRSTPGVPASVTSLGPNGFGNHCCRAGFQFGSGHHNFSFGHHQHHRTGVVVPYYYYPYYATYPSAYVAPASTAEYEAREEEEPPAPTIYERRSRIAYPTDQDRYGEHYTDSREAERRRAKAESEEERQAAEEREKRAQEEKSRTEAKPEEQEPATVLVFKDGHHQDVSSYAISGEVIYDLGHGRARKILLADLDLAATIKLNDQLGNDFRLPSRPPKQN
jgi:hypothetical protein